MDMHIQLKEESRVCS